MLAIEELCFIVQSARQSLAHLDVCSDAAPSVWGQAAPSGSFCVCSQRSGWINVGIVSRLLIQNEKKPPRRTELLLLDVSFILAGYVLPSCVNVLSDQCFPQDFSEPLSCGVF